MIQPLLLWPALDPWVFSSMVCFLSEPGEHHVLCGTPGSINFTGIIGLPACSHCVATGNTVVHLGTKVGWTWGSGVFWTWATKNHGYHHSFVALQKGEQEKPDSTLSFLLSTLGLTDPPGVLHHQSVSHLTLRGNQVVPSMLGDAAIPRIGEKWLV